MKKSARRKKTQSNLKRILPLLILTLSGCVATTTDVDRLQDSLNQVQKGQADLITKIGDLDRTIGTLNEKLSASDKKMSSLSSKLDDTQSRLGGRMELISKLLSEATTQASVPIPGDVYRTAYGDYVAGKIPLAVAGFENFLQRYPESDLADDAQFYLADSYLIKKDFKTARVQFDKVLGISQDYRRSALLKRAYALEGLEQTKDQTMTLETLIKEFPDSSEADTAKSILKQLEEAAKSKKSKPAAKKDSRE